MTEEEAAKLEWSNKSLEDQAIDIFLPPWAATALRLAGQGNPNVNQTSREVNEALKAASEGKAYTNITGPKF